MRCSVCGIALDADKGGVLLKDGRKVCASCLDSILKAALDTLVGSWASRMHNECCEMPICLYPLGRNRSELFPSEWALNVDHIEPTALGGANTAANKRPAHKLCNRVDWSVRVGRSWKRDAARIASVRLANPAPPEWEVRLFIDDEGTIACADHPKVAESE